MNNMLDDLAHGFSEKDSEMFDSIHAGFEKNASVTADEQERILSSVMRKAGFDMKENISMKKTRKLSRRMSVIMIAAAMLLIGLVFTAAYRVGHRLEEEEIIRKFYGGNAKAWLDINELNVQQTEQNEHFKITMYSPVSDGIYCNTLWCIEALDEAAQEQLGGIDFYDFREYYVDTGEEIIMNRSYGRGAVYEPLNDEFHYYYLHRMMLRNVDISREIELRIEDKPVYEWQEYDFTLKDGIKFVVNASPNVETKTIANESGRELLLSPLGISQKFTDDGYDPDERYVYLIKSDGSYEHIEAGNSYVMDEEIPWRVFMHDMSFDITDISDVAGVKIGDEIYWEVNSREHFDITDIPDVIGVKTDDEIYWEVNSRDRDPIISTTWVLN